MQRSPVSSLLLQLLCLLCLGGAWAEDCSPYVSPNLSLQKAQTCILSFCSGSCTNRYCTPLGAPLDQSQFMCIINNLYVVIGIGITLFLLLAGSIVCCCCRFVFGCCCGQRSQNII